VLLRREGWSVNRKRTYRLYREAGLAVRRRKRKRIGLFERKPLSKPLAVNRSWSMDFSMVRSAWATIGSILEALTTTTRVYLSGLLMSALVDALAIRGSRTRPTQLVSQASLVPEVQTGSRT
jgi:transposase InsO family protein